MAELLTEKAPVINKESKEKYINNKATFESERMVKYYNSSTDSVLIFNISGKELFMPFDKPYIQKSFCFGYGMYLQCTDEEQDMAYSQMERARTDFTYFLDENLSDLNRRIKTLEYHIHRLKEDISWEELHNFYRENEKHIAYRDTMREPYICYSSYVDEKQISLQYFNEEEYSYNCNRITLKSKTGEELKHIIRKATVEDLETILENYKAVKIRFLKRLNTYLKKYGLSKLRTWTYLVD